MRVILFICVAFSTCVSQESSKVKMGSNIQVNFSEIKNEIEWFIKKVKPESIGQGEFNVYVAKISETKNNYCVTMGYIQDSLFISYVKGFKYFLMIGEELVLLDYSNEFKSKCEFGNEKIQVLTDRTIVSKKIYNDGSIIGTTQGYVCCYEVGNVKKRYYENSDEIPYDKAIFQYYPNGKLIELDSNSLKEILRKRKKN